MNAKRYDDANYEKKRSAKSYSAVKQEAKSANTKVSVSGKNRIAQAVLFSQEEINKLIEHKAYALFESRGYQHGYDREDWIQAEKIILAEIS